MSDRLLPCPFCGCSAKVVTHDIPRVQSTYLVGCANPRCPALARVSGSNKQYEIDKWNTRVINGHKVTFHREPAGVIGDDPVWVVIEGIYMYGPCDKWEDVAELIRTGWEHDRFICGWGCE